MDRTQTTILLTTMIASFLCCLLIADTQSATEGKTTAESEEEAKGEIPAEESKQDSGEGKSTEALKQAPEKKRTFDFFPNGDDNLQSFNFMFELPFGEKPFKFEDIEGSFSGKYFVTFQKPDLLEDISLWESLRREFSEMAAISESFTLRLEGGTPRRLGLGGYIEMGSDYSIQIDPHLHLTGYAQYSPYTFVEVAVGGWGEVQRLGKEERKEGRYRYGLRAHLDLEHHIKPIYVSMMIEYLPDLSLDKVRHRVSASPEIEWRFKVHDKQLALVLHIEIDYYSREKDLTLEPLLDLNPLDIRWTQLIRHRF